MSRPTAIAAPVLAMCAVCVVAPRAGEIQREVRPGESASLIARELYGTPDVAELLLRYNGKRDSLIRVGERLKLPFSDVHYVERGDTWSELAQRYVGRASAYPAIATLNGLDLDEPLVVGREILMPVVLEHRLERGQTLASLAEAFYGDVRLARILETFNEVDDPRRLSVGTSVRVPLTSFVLVAPPTAPPADPPAVFDELEQARLAFEEGRFETSRRLLETVRGRVEAEGTKQQRAELWRLAAFVHVAFDDPSSACTAFDSLRELTPDRVRLDPERVSPKIREVLEACPRDRS